MINPLLQISALPHFSDIRPEHAESALNHLLENNRATIAELLAQNQNYYTWENFIAPLEELGDKLHQMWSPVSHLHAVMNSPEWREAYQACLPKLSEYHTEMGQHEGLFKAYQSIDRTKLDVAQNKVIENQLRDFHLSGIDLDSHKKKRYGQIQERLSALSTQFSNNVMDATDNWNYLVTDITELSGLPAHAIAAAKQKDKEEWLLTLAYPCYNAVITYADNRALREKIYTAYSTRASDQGPHAGRWDNSTVMTEILTLKQELAELLGFENYAALSLATKMAKHPQEVLDFLSNLANRAYPYAEKEWKELCDFAKQPLEAWDVAYYSEKLFQHRYGISEEQIRPYFPVDHVLSGLFKTVNKLYGISVKEKLDRDTWHPQVRFFEIYDAKQQLRGQFYLDLYARPNKRGGAWMDDARGRRRISSEKIQIPIAYLVCNATPPTDSTPALFTHDEVITLFHEFGHGLQHLLTRVDYADVAGINGVPWDAVELPSQFMENWCWQKESLQYLSRHYQTGESLPEEWITQLLAAKNFQAGLQINRQVLFALFDFRLHHTHQPNIQALLDELREEISVIPTPLFNRFQHSFSHIFAGGYSAGYYSYLWAEVLACDAFSAFEEKGIFDKATGQAFLKTILEQGGSRDPLDLFIEFRGRAPQIDALLRHSGLS